MINKIIKDIAENGMLPIAVYENTLHVFYGGVWYEIEEDQYEYLNSLKSIINESIESLNTLAKRVENHD